MAMVSCNPEGHSNLYQFDLANATVSINAVCDILCTTLSGNCDYKNIHMHDLRGSLVHNKYKMKLPTSERLWRHPVSHSLLLEFKYYVTGLCYNLRGVCRKLPRWHGKWYIFVTITHRNGGMCSVMYSCSEIAAFLF